MGLGSLITGYLFDRIGSSETYLVLGVSVLFVCFIQTISIQIIVMAQTYVRWRDRNTYENLR